MCFNYLKFIFTFSLLGISVLYAKNNKSEIDSLMKQGIMVDESTGLKYFTGYQYKTLYDWDQYFESIVQFHIHWPSEYIRNGVLIFLEHQKDNGFIARSVPSNDWHDFEHVKPFLSQIALFVIDNYGEQDWILNDIYFPKLKKYLDYWLEDMDSNKNGLSEWMSAAHTGMDTQHERAGFWKDRCSEGVDLNCYLFRELRAFARLAELKGEKKLAILYRHKAMTLKKKINDLLWSDEDGFYYDRMTNPNYILSQSAPDGSALRNVNLKGDLIPVKSAAAFTVLFAEVAPRDRAERLVKEHLLNPREFWSEYPLCVLSKSEPGYTPTNMLTDVGCTWRANVWIPVNYMVVHGLKYYGMNMIADILAYQTRLLISKSGNREYYNSETGDGLGLNPFWGWSLLGYFIENEPYVKTVSNCDDNLGLK